MQQNIRRLIIPSKCRGADPEKLDEDLLTCFRINTIGNIHLFNLYIPLLLKGRVKKVIYLSSGFADNELTTDYGIDVAGPYSISKAAMNTAVAKFSAQYAEQGVLFMSLAPGAVEVGQDNAGRKKIS
jgi:NAD(P)-dependent dehydrogenase (short-subunit alcohol dehydrogenase family)